MGYEPRFSCSLTINALRVNPFLWSDQRLCGVTTRTHMESLHFVDATIARGDSSRVERFARSMKHKTNQPNKKGCIAAEQSGAGNYAVG